MTRSPFRSRCPPPRSMNVRRRWRPYANSRRRVRSTIRQEQRSWGLPGRQTLPIMFANASDADAEPVAGGSMTVPQQRAIAEVTEFNLVPPVVAAAATRYQRFREIEQHHLERMSRHNLLVDW